MIVAEAIVRAQWSPEYQAVRAHHADLVADGSGVPRMQRIEEGLIILGELDASEEAMRAFCLGPLFLLDEDLVRHGQDFMNSVDADPFVILLVMEYRHRAGAWTGTHGESAPSPGPMEAVRHMLIADKVQARKDFIRHHRGKDARSAETDAHFDRWLSALGVGMDDYEALCAAIDIARSRA